MYGTYSLFLHFYFIELYFTLVYLVCWLLAAEQIHFTVHCILHYVELCMWHSLSFRLYGSSIVFRGWEFSTVLSRSSYITAALFTIPPSGKQKNSLQTGCDFLTFWQGSQNKPQSVLQSLQSPAKSKSPLSDNSSMLIQEGEEADPTNSDSKLKKGLTYSVWILVECEHKSLV